MSHLHWWRIIWAILLRTVSELVDPVVCWRPYPDLCLGMQIYFFLCFVLRLTSQFLTILSSPQNWETITVKVIEVQNGWLPASRTDVRANKSPYHVSKSFQLIGKSALEGTALIAWKLKHHFPFPFPLLPVMRRIGHDPFLQLFHDNTKLCVLLLRDITGKFPKCGVSPFQGIIGSLRTWPYVIQLHLWRPWDNGLLPYPLWKGSLTRFDRRVTSQTTK